MRCFASFAFAVLTFNSSVWDPFGARRTPKVFYTTLGCDASDDNGDRVGSIGFKYEFVGEFVFGHVAGFTVCPSPKHSSSEAFVETECATGGAKKPVPELYESG
jgi:hypothetical protein